MTVDPTVQAAQIAAEATRSTNRTTWWVGIINAVVLIVVAGVGLIHFDNRVDSLDDSLLQTTLVGVNADEYLRIDESFLATSSISQKISIEGMLLKPLPSGVQIWAGSEPWSAAAGRGSPPSGGFGVSSDGPCDVTPQDSTFTCQLYVGNDADAGRHFAMYIGLANSHQAVGMTNLLKDQNCADLDASDAKIAQSESKSLFAKVKGVRLCQRIYGQKAPDGIRWLRPIEKLRLPQPTGTSS